MEAGLNLGVIFNLLWKLLVGNDKPLQYFLPGKFYRQRSVMHYSPGGHKKSDMTEHTHTYQFF